ncbi:hypothetical protein GGI07_002515 [Coemansia sp. Benny D115]|nr:hypothetical protein GGI07_002515 [Coemansia sp. Benny D115]
MCPLPLNSYLDTQYLEDIIMNGQFPGYDGANTSTTIIDPSYNISAAFSGIADDYESHDNARARKRRITISEDRRTDDVHGFGGIAVSMGDSLFNGIFDQDDRQNGYANSTAAYHSSQADLPMLPLTSGSEDPSSLSTALTNNVAFGGMSFVPAPYLSGTSADAGSTNLTGALGGNPTHTAASRINGRKNQSLTINVNQSLRNDISSQEPPTPAMFSPSFASAMEGAAASAGMSSPAVFYNVASPFTPGHAHHHSFSMPGSTQQAHSSGMFDTGASMASFAVDSIDHNHVASPATHGLPPSISAASSFRHGTAASSNAGIGGDEDYSMGLQISMNAAMAATMNGSFDPNSHNRNGSSSSAFSRVQGAADVSHILGGNVSAAQHVNGLGLDISTTLSSLAHIHGMESFSSATLDRQNAFATSLAGGDCSVGSYGAMSSEPSSLFHPVDHTMSLQNAVKHTRFAHMGAGPLAGTASPLASALDTSMASPLLSNSRAALRSPANGTKRSRKRAATVSTIRTDNQQQQQQQPNMQGHRRSQNGMPLDSNSPEAVAASPQGPGIDTIVSRPPGGESAAYTGPVFNSQAVVRGSGSKVVMVLTSKVAQKSYGTEKRFLCPPPTILLFGDNWKLPINSDQQISPHSNDFTASLPRISVSVPSNDGAGMGSDGNDAMGSASSESRVSQLEWLVQPDAIPKPKAHIPHNAVAPVKSPRDGDTITGRFVAKQLFINDVDEKRKRVSVKVRLHDPTGQVVLNEFFSQPIKVISKPSKKRQSVKNVDLCIHHGSTISLFNRLRSQTVSTKYLGATRSMSVGGPRPLWFPARDDDSSKDANGLGPGSGSATTTTFVARNSVWDPFIIWIVDTHLGQKEIEAFNKRIAENPTPIPGYPTPPTFAMHPQCPPDFDHTSPSGSGSSGCGTPDESSEHIHIDCDSMGQPQPRAPIPILYNQPIILQCVSTGMCSPVLTLRKVEKGSTAVGAFYGRDPSRDVLGDPVSQLHKVAFEVRVQTREELPAVTVTPAGLNTRVGSYLTCLGDIVGLNATCDGRQLSSDGSSAGKSSGSRGGQGQGRKQAKDSASAGTTSWTEDVGDNAVWTMVGTDCTIYRFDYPSASDITSQLQKQQQQQQQKVSTTNTLPATPSVAESSTMMSTHTSLALPPTPTSPNGVKDYSQHGAHSHFSLEMMLGDHGSTAAAVAAAVSEINGGEFRTGSLDASLDVSLAAAVYNMSMPVIKDGMAMHQGHHHSLLSAQQSLVYGMNTVGEDNGSIAGVGGAGLGGANNGLLSSIGHHDHITGGLLSVTSSNDGIVPIVFKSTVQHPPTVTPSAFDGSNLLSAAERPCITLSGLNFTPDMVVLFDGQRSLFTEFKSSESIVCLGPLPSDSSMEGDGPFGSIYGDSTGQHVASKGGRKLLQHPSSPSASDSSANAQGHDDGHRFGLLGDGMGQTNNRASSTDSTASSATATHTSPPVGKGTIAVRGTGKGVSSGGGTSVKIPIYLSRNRGAGPTFKTGQFYTMHF